MKVVGLTTRCWLRQCPCALSAPLRCPDGSPWRINNASACATEPWKQRGTRRAYIRAPRSVLVPITPPASPPPPGAPFTHHPATKRASTSCTATTRLTPSCRGMARVSTSCTASTRATTSFTASHGHKEHLSQGHGQREHLLGGHGTRVCLTHGNLGWRTSPRMTDGTSTARSGRQGRGSRSAQPLLRWRPRRSPAVAAVPLLSIRSRHVGANDAGRRGPRRP